MICILCTRRIWWWNRQGWYTFEDGERIGWHAPRCPR